jgi:hypothetical protein
MAFIKMEPNQCAEEEAADFFCSSAAATGSFSVSTGESRL